jgi:hypothetical protein
MATKLKEISREQANAIITKHMNDSYKKVVICYAGKWYDIRHLCEAEIMHEIDQLIMKK